MKKMAVLIGLIILMAATGTGYSAPLQQRLYFTRATTLSPDTYMFRFSLWTAATAGTEAWSEEKSIVMKTQDLVTYLGSVIPLTTEDFSEQYWVQVEEKKNLADPYTALGARTKLNIVPYAMYSITSETAVSGGSVPSVTAGKGMTSTVTADGDVTLNVGPGAGINVGADTIFIKTGGVTNAMLANPALTVTAGTGLSGGGAVSLGSSTTLNIANTAVTPGSYSRANITVDQQGRLTSAASNDLVDLGTEVTGALPVANGGTGAITPTGALTGLGAAASGVNADITSISGLNTQAAITINPYNTTAGATGEIRFQGLAANGTNNVGFKAPDAIAADRIWTLPAADGTASQVLMTDGSGNLGWATGSQGDITGVTAGTGLSGGGASGEVTLNADTAYLQRRVNGSCTAGNAVRVVNPDGTVTCQTAGSGTVTSVGTGAGLTGGPIVASGTLALSNTAVTPGIYTRANITVDQQGRLTSAGNGSSVNLAAEVTGILPIANGGTGTGAQNFVDVANAQTVGGAKTFSSDVTLSGNLNLPAAGIIKAGANRLITFGASNFFAGNNAGNQTMTAPGNTAIGNNALYSNITGSRNTVSGTDALYSNTTGSYNTASGWNALNSNSAGNYNTASGYMALYYNTTGSNNTAIGNNTLYVNTTGNNNTAIGNNALLINDTGGNNTASGNNALYSNTEGYYNTASGMNALYSNTAGWYNTAGGYNALYSNTGGESNTANGMNALYSNTEGYYNTASGYETLYLNTIGYHNTANGFRALYSNQDGIDNTATGTKALFANTTGSYNTASGMGALYSNTIGYENTASGNNALYGNTTGYYNTASGNNALRFNTTGSYNTAIGNFALYYNTTGYYNTASGLNALSSNTTGAENTANGLDTLYSNTTGYDNTASGMRALYLNTTGYYNTASGYAALYANTTGYQNTASGYAALYSNTTGSENTASGNGALYSNTTGNDNTAVGYGALSSNTTGYYNTASGLNALSSNTTGVENTANGLNALRNNTTGSYNTACGRDALYYTTTGNLNTAVGYDAHVASDVSNSTAIGAHAFVLISNKVRIGGASVSVIEGQVGWSNISDIRVKKDVEDIGFGLAFIKSLRPVQYRLKQGNDRIDFGFIAQEVEAQLGVDYNVLGIAEDADRSLSLRYTDFIAPMVKAMQEQQEEIEALKAELNEIKTLLSGRK